MYRFRCLNVPFTMAKCIVYEGKMAYRRVPSLALGDDSDDRYTNFRIKKNI